MLRSYLNTQDRRTSINRRKYRYAEWGYFVAMCCTTCVLMSIASLVTISLIPLYLSSPAVNKVYNPTESEALDTEYVTNYELPVGMDSSYALITNTQELGSEITSALKADSNTISVTTAVVSSRNTKSSVRRRRLTSCAAETTSAGSRVQINLLIKYPRRCGHSSVCKAKFLATLTKLLETLPVFSPTIELQNGAVRVSVPLQICSVTVQERGATTATFPPTTSTTTACSDSAGYFEQGTGQTCQTYIDYGFCNGSSVVTTSGINSVSAQQNCCSCGKGTTQTTG
ncbi:unnamed protein product [Rotaria socialis]|uniref:Uncharacterized protein n=1 Tax=Rotaria socialis TaxID=392032 RepID=A0A818EUC8_9BILA|nr:unnamed protein product [Rotaria socialis]